MKRITLTDAPVFQGDLMIIKIAALPDSAQIDTSAEARIVAHSETGHHHVVEGDLSVYRDKSDPLVAFVECRSSIQLKHLREWDTHETLAFDSPQTDTPVVYALCRQEEFTPEGWRQVED